MFMEFYATDMGRRFFNSQLPLLIHALQDMTAALNRRPEVVMLIAADLVVLGESK